MHAYPTSVLAGQEWVGRGQGFCPPALASRGGAVPVQTASPSTGCLVWCLKASPLLGGYTEGLGERTPWDLMTREQLMEELGLTRVLRTVGRGLSCLPCGRLTGGWLDVVRKPPDRLQCGQ